MKAVFSLTLLLFIIVFSLAIPVKCSLTTQPVCPDPREDPVGFVKCYIGGFVDEFFSRVRGFFSGIIEGFSREIRKAGERVRKSINETFDNIVGFFDYLKSGASHIYNTFYGFWVKTANLALGLGPFAPVAFFIVVIAVAVLVYLIIRIVAVFLA